MKCPKCNDDCDRDSVNVGVGIIYGPYGCYTCGWSQDKEYDLSTGKDPIQSDGCAIDQFGKLHPPGSIYATVLRWSRNHND